MVQFTGYTKLLPFCVVDYECSCQSPSAQLNQLKAKSETSLDRAGGRSGDRFDQGSVYAPDRGVSLIYQLLIEKLYCLLSLHLSGS